MPRRGQRKPFNTDKRTRHWIDDFLTAEIEEMSSHTVEDSYATIRTHLREAIRASNAALGHRSLVAIAEAEEIEQTQWLRRLMNELDDRHSEGYCLNITQTLELFFEHLRMFAEDVDVGDHNIGKLRARFGWKYNRNGPNFEPDPQVVKSMYRAATKDWERALVVLFAGCGLRTKDIERIHVDDINPNPNDPHISFADRKTNPGEIAVMAGMPVLQRTARQVRQKAKEDNPPLFPSNQSATGTRRGSWATKHIKRLSKEAGERRSDGDLFKPKNLATIYKNKYTEARTLWIEAAVKELTDNLELDSEKIQVEHYIQDKGFRGFFTSIKNAKFKEMFPPDIVHDETTGFNQHTDKDQSGLDEFFVDIFGVFNAIRGTIAAGKHMIQEAIAWPRVLRKRWKTDDHTPGEDITKLIGFVLGMALITAIGFYQLGMGIDPETMTVYGHPIQWLTVVMGHAIAIALHYQFETIEIEGFVPSQN